MVGKSGISIVRVAVHDADAGLANHREAGVPGYDAPNSVGILAPAGTPREIVGKLQQEIARIVTMRDVQERLLAAGIEPSSMKPENFTEHIRAEVAKWNKVVKAAGIEPQTW